MEIIRKCRKCNKNKDLKLFQKNNRCKEGRTHTCSECLIRDRKLGGARYEKHLADCKRYRDRNKELKRIYNAKYDGALYQRERAKKDPLFKMCRNLRSRLKDAIKVKLWKKNTHFSIYIGCSQKELLSHLESQFTSGMTWNNYGEWEIDHIKPLSKAATEKELYERCHFSNLQPLWKADNRKKGNK